MSSGGYTIIIGLLLAICLHSSVVSAQLDTIYSWKNIEFVYDDPEQEKNDRATGVYNPDNVVLVDADVYQGTYYVSTPPLIPGSPVTLSTVTNQTDSNGSYKLAPFPNWFWNHRNSCDILVSVYRFKIDKFGRLWVLDSGRINDYDGGNSTQVCLPKLLVFNLNNNTLLRRNRFRATFFTSESLMLNIELQIHDETGEETTAYIADARDYRMYVYNFKEDKAIVVKHPYFSMDADNAFFDVNGAQFTLYHGLYTMALDRVTDTMFFHSLTSLSQRSVGAQILRKGNLTEDERRRHFRNYIFPKDGHTTVEVMTDDSVLIFATEQNDIRYYDTKPSFVKVEVRPLIKDDVRLQAVSGMKIIDEQDLLVVSDRAQNVIAYGHNEKGVINFRILRGNIRNLIINAVHTPDKNIITDVKH